jgi:RNA polymerase sigma-70 factor (ECF subfamily)
MEAGNHEQAFGEAFEQYSDELFRHASLRLSDRERAVELTQECFLRAWDYLVRGKTIEQYRPFLYRTLNNLIVDEYRRHKSQSLDALLEKEETASAVEGELLRDETDVFEEVATQFDAKAALAVVAQLPENYRTVVILRYVDGFLPSEIAEFLHESENAVSVRIHRGMRKLRELLASSPHIRP